jgi:hypothetical protein
MFWPVVRYGLIWAGVDPFEGGAWLNREYFISPYVAALVLGLVTGRWRTAWVALVGAVASLIVTVGERATSDALTFYTDGAAWSVYVEAVVVWLWMAGLIGLGVALSQRVGSQAGDGRSLG